MFKEFKKFIMRGNVLDMAVGIIIGNAFKDIVDSLVDNIIMPAISCLIGKVDISGLTANIGEIHIAYGQFLNTILNFLIIAFSLFMAIKIINKINDINKAALSKLGKKVEENHSDTFRMEVSFFGFLEHYAQDMAFQSGKRIFHMVICTS